MGETVLRALVLAVLLGGCTKRVNQCSSDSDCKDPAYPFCDVNGEYPASGGAKDVCTVTPTDCPVDRCGCTPGAVLSCSGDQETVCAADGKSTTTSTCSLGCFSDGTRCATFEPSNGLGGALSEAASEPDVMLPAGAKIDTDTGVVTDSAGAPVTLHSEIVAQPGAPSIRVFTAKSLTVEDLTVTGGNALAFVASGTLTIEGDIELAAHAAVAGPGAASGSVACAGMDSQQTACGSGQTRAGGASGAGNATAGGDGGIGPMGGMAVSSFSPLVGGCSGGSLRDDAGTLLAAGGAGGGALQLVSGALISISGRGFINVAGGGGGAFAGGGSAGTVILEAPQVTISGALSGVTANGGAGGGCSMMGPDGQMGTAPAITSGCTDVDYYGAGDGGTGMVAATKGDGCVPSMSRVCQACYHAGGGGGAAGRLRIATRDGAYASDSSPVLSAVISTATLQPK